MAGRHYHKELIRLKEFSAEFAEAWPALAPMLGGPTTDPDAERLLEGTAFKIGLLREKLDLDFPEVVNELLQRLFPHYPRHFPAATIVAFTVKQPVTESCIIPAGTLIDSVPLDGTSCTFATAWDVELHPLHLADVTVARTSVRETAVRLSLALSGLPLAQWRAECLSLLVTGGYISAADLFLCLNRHLKRIVVTPEEGGTPLILPPDCLKPFGFDSEAPLLPYPPHAFPGFRLLQEYFSFPEKFLSFNLTGLDRWQDRGEGYRFTITFELDGPAFGATHVKRDSFALFAVPAVNLFPHEADPILLDHRATGYLLRPSGPDPAHYQIFSVDKVTGLTRRTGQERSYAPFDLFRPDCRDVAVYHTLPRKSPVHAGFDLYLSVAFPQGSPSPEEETLSIELTCSNGTLPEGLHVGDVSLLSSGAPDCVSVRNITPISAGTFPPLAPDLADRFATHLFLASLSLANANTLRLLLDLYVFSGNRSRASVAANKKRVAGIEEVTALPCDRWVRGKLMSGREIRIKTRKDHFGGPGDLYLFGCVLERFLAQCAEPNTFTMLTLEETLKGGVYQWPPRLGRKPLL
jgi:type VI secretion system protein ImpG